MKDPFEKNLEKFVETHPAYWDVNKQNELLGYMNDNKVFDFNEAYEATKPKITPDNIYDETMKIMDREEPEQVESPIREEVNPENIDAKFDEIMSRTLDGVETLEEENDRLNQIVQAKRDEQRPRKA